MNRVLILVCCILVSTAYETRGQYSLFDRDIEDQIDMISEITRKTGQKLSSNQDFLYWLLD